MTLSMHRPTTRYARRAPTPTSTSTLTSFRQVTNAPHKATLSHELIAGAAAYEAAKAYENHVAKNGHPDNHA